MRPLPFDKKKIDEIVAKYPTPFHLYDEKGMLENLKELQEAFAWNEGFREYFAVKAEPNPVLLKLLHENGCGMDCSSYTELMLCEALGIKGEDIVFSSNATPAEDFEYARKLDAYINLDDITHIAFLEQHGGIPETVCCRYNPGGEFRLGNTIMGNPGDAKYGMTPTQLTHAFRTLKNKGVKKFGLHAFLASNTTDPGYYPGLARVLFRTARELHEELGVEIDFIDLSGGIGIPYRPEEQKTDIFMVGAAVKQVYDEVFGGTDMKVRLFAELGRYITGPFGCLVTHAIHEKDIYKHYIGLDACAANLMRPAIYGSYHHISVMGKEHLPHDRVYDVTGGLCENCDKFAVDRLLPKIDVGDIVVIHDTGAHGFSMGYNYNGKLRSAEVLLKSDGSTELIRRAETPMDYFATLDILNLFGEEK
ncbi:MAG: diaminopimelate decarboxylase [Clostridia bacterium]|nr:diaminopimelate decarboxylase [Clostridia bacterium]MBR0026323.1 diaminopimelate decarboxylase [Clostridia bacterium]